MSSALTGPPGASSSRQPQPGVSIQYRHTRARALTTAQGEQHSGPFQLRIAHEFLADLKALYLEVPGVVMNNMTIVWQSGQVRATFEVHGREFCEIIKFMVKRASTRFAHIMSGRSISQIQYIEDGVLRAIAALPHSLPDSTRSCLLPQAPDGASIRSSTITMSCEEPAVSTLSKKRRLSTHDSVVTPVGAESKRPAIHHERPALVSSIPISTSHVNREPFLQIPVSTPSGPQSQFHPLRQVPAMPQPRNLKGMSGEHKLSQIPYTSPGPSSIVHHLPPRPMQPQNCTQPPVPLTSSAVKTTDPQLRQAASRLACSSSTTNLTPGACVRLRDPADSDILTSGPVVRILVLRDKNGNPARGMLDVCYAFVTDGSDYARIALPNRPNLGKASRWELQVGAAVKLVSMYRLPPNTSSAMLVDELEVVGIPVSGVDLSSESDAGPSTGEPPCDPEVTLSDDPAGILQQERDARLLAESKLKDEQRRRAFIENLLADVCRDLDSRETLVPAAMEALTKLAELTDAAMPVD